MRNCLFGWCEQSQKVRQSLAERGVIEKLSCELAELRTVPEINEVSPYTFVIASMLYHSRCNVLIHLQFILQVCRKQFRSVEAKGLRSSLAPACVVWKKIFI